MKPTGLHCPTCGHELGEVPVAALADARISATERKIVDALASVYPRSMALSSIVDAIYADDPQGGPDRANQVVSVLLTRLRAKLPAYGWTIPRNAGGTGIYGRYRLEKI